MHYLIDGYNFFFRLTQDPNPLHKKRTKILEILNQELAHAHLKATIIFDSSEEKSYGVSRSHVNTLEIIYTSQGLTADDYILEMLAHATHKHQTIVVTDDRALAKHARSLGAHSSTIAAFLKVLNKKQEAKCKTDLHAPESKAELARLLKIFEERFKKF